MIYALIGIYSILVFWLIAVSIKDNRSKKRLILKSMCAVMILILLVVAQLTSSKVSFEEFLILLLAEILCVAGDWFLGLYNFLKALKKRIAFLLGVGCFFLAHCVFSYYFIFYFHLQFDYLYIIMPLISLILIFIALRILKLNNKTTLFFCLFYSLAVALMAVSAFKFGLYVNNLFPCVGGVLFLISDYILAFKYFMKKRYAAIIFGAVFAYFAAQLMFVLYLL